MKQLLNKKAEFAYLYGSIVSDRFTEKSDIDVAVYLKRTPQNIHEQWEFMSDLNKNFIRNIDVVLLNNSDIIITMQILAKGELIVNNNPRHLIEFKTKALSQYPDFKMSRKIIEDHLLNGRIYA